MILPASWFDHLEENFSHKEVQVKNICLTVNASTVNPPTKVFNKTVVVGDSQEFQEVSWPVSWNKDYLMGS